MVKFEIKCKDAEGHELKVLACESGTMEIDSSDFTMNLDKAAISTLADTIERIKSLLITANFKSIEIEKEEE